MENETIFDGSIWLAQYLANYNGISVEGKELEKFIKEAGDAKYIPWATMERMMYQQDPDAETFVLTDKDGYIVHPNKYTMTTEDITESKKRTTSVDCFSHMVVLRCTFLGKTIEEHYPIQLIVKKEGYTAPKAIDQNQVNRSIKRGLAKIISRNTGLALRLYEDGDLQFDDAEAEPTKNKVETPPKPTLNIDGTKTIKATEEKTSEPAKPIEEKEATKPTALDNHIIWKLAEELHNNKDIEKGVQATNAAVMNKYGFVIDLSEEVRTIYNKLLQVKDAVKFVRTLKLQSGLEA